MSLETPSKRGRLTEKEYFHRLDVEMLDPLRKRAVLEGERLQLAAVGHIKDQGSWMLSHKLL